MVDYESTTDYAVATGEFIEDWLADNEMRPAELARRMGVSRKHVSKLLAGAPLTPDVATRLELVTGVPARRWLALESLYRADLARLALEVDLAENKDLLDEVPLSDLRKRGFVTVTRAKPGQALRECMAFFRVGDIDGLRDILCRPAVAFRQSQAHAVKWASVATWLRLGEIVAADSDVNVSYDKQLLLSLLPDLRALSVGPATQFGDELVRMLSSAGIVLVYVPEVHGARAYGATRWLNGRPIIQLSLRGLDDGHFWFTLFHEIGHVLRHPHNEVFIRSAEDGDAGIHEKAEGEADKFASDYLIPTVHVDELTKLRSIVSVVDFARRIGVSPGVVVGRLHHDGTWPHKNGRQLYRRLGIVGDE